MAKYIFQLRFFPEIILIRVENDTRQQQNSHKTLKVSNERIGIFPLRLEFA